MTQAVTMMSPLRRFLMVSAVMAATITQFLDATIANVALPHMQSSLGATFDSIAWVLTSFMLASAVAIPIAGWIAGRFGIRKVFLGSVIGFVVTSMACGAAITLPQMVLFRFLQGMCAALISPLSQTIILDSSPPEKHVRAMAIWGMASMIGPIAGPVLGGFLTENMNWRWVFYINVPIGVVAIAILWFLLPEFPSKSRKLDLFGFVLLAVGMAMLQLALDRGQHLDWLQSWEIVIELVICVSAIWVFLIHSITSKSPLFEKTMFKDSNYTLAMGFMVLVGFMMFGISSLLPSLMQSVFGFPVLETGILTAPRGFGILVSMGFVPRLVTLVSRKWLVAAGFAVSAYSVEIMTHWTLETPPQLIAWCSLVQGFGLGLMFVPLNTLAFENLPSHLRTDGASVLNLMRTFGASVGISFFATEIARSMQRNHEELGSRITEYSFTFLDPNYLRSLGGIGSAAMSVVDLEITRQAAMIAYLNAFEILFYMMVAMPLLALLLKGEKKSRAGNGVPIEAMH